MKRGFAVVGVGMWGQIHIETYLSDPNSELIAICDKNEERIKQIAEKYDIRKFTTEYSNILEDPEVEAISIATPDFAHKEIAVNAAKAGKHILVEKPLAITVQDCEEIIRTANTMNVKLMVDFHNRFNPPFVKVKESVENGEIGIPSLLNIRLNLTRDFPLENLKWAEKSNVAFFMGSHAIDLTCWILNDTACEVYAVSRSGVLSKAGKNIQDFYYSIISFNKGTIAIVENSWVLPYNSPTTVDFKLELIGEKGAAYVDASHNRCIEKYVEGKVTYPNVLIFPFSPEQGCGFAVDSIKHFINCVVKDCEPSISGYDGLVVTKIIEKIIESSNSGIQVKI